MILKTLQQEIDNPGKGSCGIYAVAIGLMPHLKKEIAENRPDGILSKLIEEGRQLSNFNENEFKQQIIQFCYHAKANEEILSTLNLILRSILIKARQRSLLNGHIDQPNELSSLFEKFYNPDGKYDFAILSHCPNTHKAVREIAIQTKTLPNTARLSLVMSEGRLTLLNKEKNKEKIFNALKKDREAPHWVSSEDLACLAEELHFTLNIEGQPIGHDIPGQPVVLLRHRGGRQHWTTLVDVFPKVSQEKKGSIPGEISKFSSFMESPDLTLVEIKNVISGYIKRGQGFFFFHRPVHHVAKANAINAVIDEIAQASVSDNDKIKVREVIEFIRESYGEISSFSLRSDFRRRLEYLCYRYDGHGLDFTPEIESQPLVTAGSTLS